MSYPYNASRVFAVAVHTTCVLVLFLLCLSFFASRLFAAGEGEDVYKAKCANCHAADGSGNTTIGKKLKAPDLGAPQVQKKSDAEITQIIAKGKDKMPPFEKSLSDDQIHG